MLGAAHFVKGFARLVAIAEAQTRDLTHADSLRQPPEGGNCLNWALGHLLDSRNEILKLLGAEPVAESAAARYRRDSEPVAGDGEDVLSLEALVDALRLAQARTAERLAPLTQAELEAPATFVNRTLPLEEILLFLYFHESYHAGQLEFYRRLAGRTEKVI